MRLIDMIYVIEGENMVGLIKRIFSFFGISIEDKSTELFTFYSMVVIEILAMFFVMAFQLVMRYETKSILPLFLSIIYLLFVLFFSRNHQGQIMFFKTLTLIPMLFVIIPYLYMGTEGGGIKSGMPVWMVLGLLMICLFTKGIYFCVLFPVTLTLYICCISYSYHFLRDELGQMEELYYYQDNILAIVAVSVSCGLVFKYQQRYEERSKKNIEREKQKAQKANEAKSKFLANMSHDIRTPMNAILGMTEMANYNIDNKEKVQDCLKKINDSSVMLLHLINNVLDMSEIESHELKLKEVRFELKEFIIEIYNVLEQRAASKGLTLEVCCDKVQDNSFVGDVVRFRQVIMNLLSNSIKFTPTGGKVSLIVEQLEEESKALADEYAFFKIEVADNGIGMKKEFVETMIFKPFERDETQYVNKTEGSGIGMSITKTILDVMGADLEIDSELGKGTRFLIKMKLKKDTEVKQEEKEDNKIPNAKGKKLMVVEDNEINMEIILAILQRTGAEVISAWSAEEAIQIFEDAKDEPLDLILMDIQLPGMTGYEATEKIRKMGTYGETIPVFAMTANAFSQDVEQSAKSGMNEHISKPIDIHELYQKMQKYLVLS
ncbi:MAG: response regulator [Lachnospiraceae bacterium]|nr:response regulator [Lachnospiraceae bacterium]